MSTRNPQFLVDQMKATHQGAHVSDEALAFALGIAVIYQFVLNQEIVLSNSSNPISLNKQNTFYRK